MIALLPAIIGLAGLAAAADSPPASPPLEERVELLERLLLVADEPELPSASARGGVRVQVDQAVRNAVGLGGPVEIAGSVHGHAVGLGGDVYVEPGGQVDGDAVSLGGQVRVDDGGEVTGRTLALTPQESARSLFGLPGGVGAGDLFERLSRRLAVLLGFVAAGTLAISLWPDQVDEIGRRLSDRPFWYGIAGAVLTMALLLGAVVFALTVIGLPLALLFVFVLGLAWLMGLVAACRSVGRRLLKSSEYGEVGAWLVGASLFIVLAMVPALGTVVVMLIGFPAVGAAVVAGLSREPAPRSW